MHKLGTVDVLYPSHCLLGESPLWHAGRGSCFWIDIKGHQLFEYHLDDGRCTQYQVEPYSSFIGQCTDDQFIIASQKGIFHYALNNGKKQLIADLGRMKNNYRCNDGAIDSQGRLWIGTMDMAMVSKGCLYCVEGPQHKVTEKLAGLAISNGIAWSLDDKTMYHIDSLNKHVDVYDYAAASAEITKSRTPIKIPEDKGLPDGMTIDREGNLWIAFYGGYGLGKFNPATGELLDFIEVPCPNVTSCCFAGEELDLLIITTARDGMDSSAQRSYPLSGHTFVTKVAVPGVPEYKYVISYGKKTP